jgi:hypothetical protein
MPRLARSPLFVVVHYALREVARKRGTSGSGANSQLRTRRQGRRAGGSGGRCVLSGRRAGLSWGRIRNHSSMPPCQHVSKQKLVPCARYTEAIRSAIFNENRFLERPSKAALFVSDTPRPCASNRPLQIRISSQTHDVVTQLFRKVIKGGHIRYLWVRRARMF